MVGKLTFYNTNTTYTRDSDLKPPPPLDCLRGAALAKAPGRPIPPLLNMGHGSLDGVRTSGHESLSEFSIVFRGG